MRDGVLKLYPARVKCRPRKIDLSSVLFVSDEWKSMGLSLSSDLMGAAGFKRKLTERESPRESPKNFFDLKLECRALGLRMRLLGRGSQGSGFILDGVFDEPIFPVEGSPHSTHLALEPGEIPANQSAILELSGESLRCFGSLGDHHDSRCVSVQAMNQANIVAAKVLAE